MSSDKKQDALQPAPTQLPTVAAGPIGNLAKLDPRAQLAIAEGAAQALLAVIETAQIIVKGREYRANLAAAVQSLKDGQAIRHADVEKLLDFLREFGPTMEQATRDECYRAVLAHLQPGAMADGLRRS